MGLRTVPAATTDPALAVPPYPGPPGRGPRRAPRPARRPRPGTGDDHTGKAPSHSAAGEGYGAVDAAAAWNRRRRDLDDLDDIIEVLTDVERRADELNRRAAELVDEWL